MQRCMLLIGSAIVGGATSRCIELDESNGMLTVPCGSLARCILGCIILLGLSKSWSFAEWVTMVVFVQTAT